MIEGLEGLGYLEKLRILTGNKISQGGFDRGVQHFKGLDKLDPERFFDVAEGETRGHRLKLFERRMILDVGKYKFGNRVCDEWNWLADDVVMADSLKTFKAKLDHHLRILGVCLSYGFFPCLGYPGWMTIR